MTHPLGFIKITRHDIIRHLNETVSCTYPRSLYGFLTQQKGHIATNFIRLMTCDEMRVISNKISIYDPCILFQHDLIYMPSTYDAMLTVC